MAVVVVVLCPAKMKMRLTEQVVRKQERRSRLAGLAKSFAVAESGLVQEQNPHHQWERWVIASDLLNTPLESHSHRQSRTQTFPFPAPERAAVHQRPRHQRDHLRALDFDSVPDQERCFPGD